MSHAVLSDQGFYYLAEAKWHHVTGKSLEDAVAIAELARERACQYVWLLPNSHLYQRLSAEPLIFDDHLLTHWFVQTTDNSWKVDHATLPGEPIHQLALKRWGEGDRAFVYLNLPRRLEDWQLERITDPGTLYGAIAYLEELLEIEIKNKPNTTGINLIEKLNSQTPARRRLIHEIEADLSPWHDNKPFDLSWMRPLTATEQAKAFIYIYDKNQQYLSASNIYLGVGEPVYEVKPTFDKTIVGLWHIKLKGKSQWDGKQLPHPLGNSQKPQLAQGWFATPQVQLAHHCGYQVEVLEAHLFKQRAKVLEPFYKLLTHALDELKNNSTKYKNEIARKAAIRGVKATFRSAIGLFDASIHSKRKWSMRPDWRWMIISEARARMFYNIETLLAQGIQPVAARTDALYFASDGDLPLSEAYKLEARYDMAQVSNYFSKPFREFIREMDRLKSAS